MIRARATWQRAMSATERECRLAIMLAAYVFARDQLSARRVNYLALGVWGSHPVAAAADYLWDMTESGQC